MWFLTPLYKTKLPGKECRYSKHPQTDIYPKRVKFDIQNHVIFKNTILGSDKKISDTEMGKFLRDSRNICTTKSFPIMNLKEGMTLNFSLYVGFC